MCFYLKVHLSTRQALQIIDKERGDNKNELCKLLVNVAPFDEIISDMREKARVTENLKEVEEKLVALATSEAFKTAKDVLAGEHSLFDAMSTVTVVFEELDLQCRDLPATKVQSESIMAGLTSIFTALEELAAPPFYRLSIDISNVEKQVVAALEATTATTAPEIEAWMCLKDTCSLAVGNLGVRQWIAIVKRVCSKGNMELSEFFQGLCRYLSASEVFVDLINATFTVIQSIAAPEAERTQVVADTCRALNEFLKSYDRTCEVIALACSCAVLFSLCCVQLLTFDPHILLVSVRSTAQLTRN